VRGDSCLERCLGPAGSSPRPRHSLTPTVPVVRGEAGALARSVRPCDCGGPPRPPPPWFASPMCSSLNPAFLPVGGFGEWRPWHEVHTGAMREGVPRAPEGERVPPSHPASRPTHPVPQAHTCFHVVDPRGNLPAGQAAGQHRLRPLQSAAPRSVRRRRAAALGVTVDVGVGGASLAGAV